MVHLDPIVVYRVTSDAPGVIRDNLGHVRDLFVAMNSLRLTRLHISFMQFDWQSLAKRIRESTGHILFLKLNKAQQEAILLTKVLPLANEFGIKLQTCTAMDMVSLGYASQGACVGWEDIYTITNGEIGPIKIQKPKTDSDASRHCTCYPHQDVADKYVVRCTHGCRYCFIRPEIYDW